MMSHVRIVLVLTAVLCLFTAVSVLSKSGSIVQDRIEKLSLNANNGTADIVAGRFGSSGGAGFEQAAVDFIGSRPDLFGLKQAKVELRARNVETDKLGATHVRLDQVYQGVRVWGCQKIVHFKDANTIYLVAGQTIPTPVISVTPTVLPANAEVAAVNAVRGSIGSAAVETSSELVVYPDKAGKHLTWLVTVAGSGHAPIRWQVFVDAATGAIVHAYNDMKEDGPTVSTGIGVRHLPFTLQTYQLGTDYELLDVSRAMYAPPPENVQGVIVTYYYNSGQIVTDPNQDNVFDDDSTLQVAVSAHSYAGETYKYFYDQFGRSSYDNAGGSLRAYIHYGSQVNNAYGGGGSIWYGDGDGINYLPFSGDLDVVAHEFTHSVTGTTAGLIYEFQSGALNESYSDFFGKMVDSSNWLLGDGIRLSAPGYLRNFQDPHLGPNPTRFPFGYQPARLSEYVDSGLSWDNGGVHCNSGIPNKAGYLVASVIGRPKAADIWYRTLSVYLTPSSDLSFWSNMTMQSAIDLYGDPSPELTAVANAMDSIGFSLLFTYPSVFVSVPAALNTVVDTSVTIQNRRAEAVTILSYSTTQGKVVVSGVAPRALASGDTAQYKVTFDATTGYTQCDLGSIKDTVVFATSSVNAPTIRVPVSINLGYVRTNTYPDLCSTSCLSSIISNVPNLTSFERSGNNALSKATLLIGYRNGNDTVVYMDLYQGSDYVPVDTVGTATLGNGDITKSFRLSPVDGAVQGRVTYQYEPTDVPGCGYIVADYKLYNMCGSTLITLSGLLADFDVLAAATNLCSYDVSKKMIYIRDADNQRACGLSLLSRSPRNLRAIHNPSLVFDGLTDGEAYSEMAATTNVSGTTGDDWTALLTFGQDTLGASDTAHYRVAMLYSAAGSTGLSSILAQVNSNSCCVGKRGNVNGVGIVDLADLSLFICYITGGCTLPCADAANVNGAGIIDLSDLSSLLSYLTGGGYVLPNCP